jgi:ADP-L-glycero-D-manno-heptose 6-epimerase
MIVVTGAAGFIGSCVISKLNNEGYQNIIAVDDFSQTRKALNLRDKTIHSQIERDVFITWLEKNATQVEAVIHIGARTDTTEFNWAIFEKLNVNYTKSLWEICARYEISFIYASSAATYGLGELGYEDDESKITGLKPLNPYGDSKQVLDVWALKQQQQPPHWHGLKFFNVYGPNEYHKARMASVIFHAYHQIQTNGQVKLFRSHNPNYLDGGQLRDFVYVKDVVNVIHYLLTQKPKNGIYNLGSGKARTFLDLTNATFHALDKTPVIEFIDTPIDIRDKYQYFTEAKMEKLISTGYDLPFTSLEDGVKNYVQGYLMKAAYL